MSKELKISLSTRIFVAGARGMVGSSIVRELNRRGFEDLLTPSSDELDLTDQKNVTDYFKIERPEVVILSAARVGGIGANNNLRAQFIYENLMIEANVIHASHSHDVGRLVFLGSSCIYPRMAPQPLKEEYLLSGPLEYTNEPYAVAKIAGIKLCESYYRQYGRNFYSVMPTNLYGPNDNFDLESSHVIPALVRKFHEAKRSGARSVELWGTGKARREFMYVDDLASALAFLLENCDARDLYDNGISHINIGTGIDLEIGELARLIADLTGFQGDIIYDSSKPDGTPRKQLDVSRIEALGWRHSTSLADGLKKTYEWFVGAAEAHA